MRHLNALPAPLIYAAAMAWTKGLALLSVPLLTANLSPTEFGRLELLASAAEIGGVLINAGLVDTLYRFASAADGRAEAGRVMGLALAIAATGFLLVMLCAGPVAALLPLPTPPGELRLLGTAVVLEAVIGVPLGWLRMHGRAWQFALLTGARATLQVGLMAALVLGGWGIGGVLAAGAVAGLLLAGLLTAGQARVTGIGFDRHESLRLLGYGIPLVGSGLAAFVLGTADRWLLAGAVPAAALGCYGLAVKISMIVALLAQPFELWWYPRRLVVLAGPDGRAQSSRVVTAGATLLVLAGGTVALAGPLLVTVLAPAVYAPAARMVPLLALALVLQLASSMANVGCYARRTGTQPMAVNAAAACVALAFYLLLIPRFGVDGAIAATVVAQAARLALFATLSQRTAPLDWKLPRLAAVAATPVLAVLAGGPIGAVTLGLAGLLALALGLVPVSGCARPALASA